MEKQETIRRIKEFIESVSGLPVIVEDNSNEFVLRLGMAQPLVIKHSSRNEDLDEDLEYVAWTRFLEVFACLMRQEEFNPWLGREKAANN